MITNEMLEVHLQPIQEKFIRISLLQNFFITEDGYQVRKFRKIGEIQGNAIGGSININANSSVRRTCSIDMIITGSDFLISENSKIWIDKWFKVELGIRSLKTDKIVWFNKGIYAINNPSVKYSHIEKSLHVEGLDLMCTLDGTLGGVLGHITKLPKENGIANSIKYIVWQLGKISKTQIYIEQNNLEMPYTIEKNETDTIYSLLEEIRNLYMNWEIFFDENGRFTYQKVKNRYVENLMPNYQNDVIQYMFLEEHDLATSYNINYKFDNIKNKIIVWGRLLDNGTQIKSEILNTDENSPFNVNKNLGIIPLAIKEDKIFTTEQAQQRAEYELYKYNNLNEQVNIEMLPVYFLDVNQLIEFNKPEIGLVDKYLIDTISIPLNATGRMSLSAHRIYKI